MVFAEKEVFLLKKIRNELLFSEFLENQKKVMRNFCGEKLFFSEKLGFFPGKVGCFPKM